MSHSICCRQQVSDDEGGIAYLTEQSGRRTGRGSRKTGIRGGGGRNDSLSDLDVVKAEIKLVKILPLLL